MKIVNYHIIGEIFGLLERIELIQEVEFANFDPDDKVDAATIADDFLAPALSETSSEKQERIRWSIEYYSATKTAPFQVLRDRCQELTLTDADDWPKFFAFVGARLFGEDFSASIEVEEYKEMLDEEQGQMIFANV